MLPVIDSSGLCFQVRHDSSYLVDPSLGEEEMEDGEAGSGRVMVVYLPSLDEVTALKQNGLMEADELMTVSQR